ncbi:hypothetical protein RF11_01907 [Thelohanellus kitauei]|uniref:Kelch domain-containing protein 10 n=1 Tax=Thelohanellus kitauei TaxID=669202 RepID=A0A0C2MHS3_THEKT|nr:hypothetical protein RF11_01907 [Thelohanellus kitauei]
MKVENQQKVLENRICYRMTSVREFLIICGGYDYISGAANNALFSYNTIRGVWKRYPLPIKLENISRYPKICSFGNKVYMCGVDSPYVIDPKIYYLVSFNVTDSTWQILYLHDVDHACNEPPPMRVNLLFYHNESLYVLGMNRDNQNSEDDDRNIIYKFCLQTLTWSVVQQIGATPIFYDEIYGKVFNNRLYIFDSNTYSTTSFREVMIFDFSTNIWTKSHTHSKNNEYPHGRFRESYAFSSDSAYMSGGITPNITSNGTTCYSDIWRIDLETLEFFKLNYDGMNIACQLSVISIFTVLECVSTTTDIVIF